MSVKFLLLHVGSGNAERHKKRNEQYGQDVDGGNASQRKNQQYVQDMKGGRDMARRRRVVVAPRDTSMSMLARKADFNTTVGAWTSQRGSISTRQKAIFPCHKQSNE
jgi:hypothetical protein